MECENNRFSGIASQSENRTRVILSPSEGSAFVRYSYRIGVLFRNYQTKKQILRRSTPQNDIATEARCEEGEIKMIEKSEVAQHISSLMLEVSGKINESISVVKRECTAQEFEAYRKASAKVMGHILLEVLNPIYAAHPEMKPKGLSS